MPPLMLRQIVEQLGGEAVGEVKEPLTRVATLDSAGPRHIAFLANPAVLILDGLARFLQRLAAWTRQLSGALAQKLPVQMVFGFC